MDLPWNLPRLGSGRRRSVGERREHPHRGRPLPDQVPRRAARRPVAPVGEVQHAHVRGHLVAPLVRPRPVVGEVHAVAPQPGAAAAAIHRDAQRRALPQEQRAPAQDAAAALAVHLRPPGKVPCISGGGAGAGLPLEELDVGRRVLDAFRQRLPGVPRVRRAADPVHLEQVPRRELHEVPAARRRHGARACRAAARRRDLPGRRRRRVHVPRLDAPRGVHRVHRSPLRRPISDGRANGVDPAARGRVEQSPLRVPCPGDGEAGQGLADEQHGVAAPGPRRRSPPRRGHDDGLLVDLVPEPVRRERLRRDQFAAVVGEAAPEVVARDAAVRAAAGVDERERGDGWQMDLRAGDRVQELQLRAGVGGDEPPVGRRADAETVRGGGRRLPDGVRPALRQAQEPRLRELGVAAATAAPPRGRVEGEHEPRGQRRGAARSAGGRLPRGTDGGEAEAVRHGEAAEDGLEEVAREVRPARRPPAGGGELAHGWH
ncbi:hypothetical protein PAHAL_4G021000 [Panicum hallii]|uniref:Uncharacterized protein n=1 Tax=Panicum hallii TaxID=206008 RepID=A0A2T8JBG0_9POAL|nr:hypothetical protein PAHAL_4G021000 [Panicum hallii]